MIRRTGLVLTLTLSGIAALAPARAHPPYRKALVAQAAPTLAGKLNDCRTCHDGPEGRGGRRLNPFGARLQEIKFTLREQGKKTAILTRLELIADEDSDCDGVANLLELLSGHFPGEADDLPRADEIERARQVLETRRAAAGNPDCAGP